MTPPRWLLLCAALAPAAWAQLPLPTSPSLPPALPATPAPPVAAPNLPAPPSSPLPADSPPSVSTLPGAVLPALPSVLAPLGGAVPAALAPLLNSLSPGTLAPLPQALAELLQGGQGPQLSCLHDPSCWLSQALDGPLPTVAALPCEVLGSPSLDLPFGSLPSGQRARDYAVRTSLAVRCAPQARFRLNLQSTAGAPLQSSSRFPVRVGERPAWIELRSDGSPLPDAEFVGNGDVQFIPVEAWLTEDLSAASIPRSSGTVQPVAPVTLAIRQGL